MASQESRGRPASNGVLPPIAIYIPTLAGGGAELSMLRLGRHLIDHGYDVDIVVNRAEGPHRAAVPEASTLVELPRMNKWRARLTVLARHPGDRAVLWPALVRSRRTVMGLRYIGGLTHYLQTRRPAVLISTLYQANLIALWARRLAQVTTPVIVTERNTLSQSRAAGMSRTAERGRWQHLPRLIATTYGRADAIVSVSDGVADDLARLSQLPRAAITTIYNPVVSEELTEKAAVPCAHAWFASDAPPVILAVGRLEEQKDYPTLLRAFADMAATTNARLVILGEGSLRQSLEQLAARLGIADRVDLPGWAVNPYCYMARAAVFVLSSRWEGLPAVLIEALACGCPVVATDCPSGPREILDGGIYGALVPVGDSDALGAALSDALVQPADATRQQQAAARFTAGRSVSAYCRLIERVRQGG